MKNMKKINVTSSSMPPFEEYIEKIRPLWDSKWLTNCGSMHNLLEEKLQEYLGVKNVSLFSNGHLALYTALNSLNLTGEVITTPFTFISTTHAIVQNGLTPVFCDINPDDYTIDVNKIEKLITDKTSAIVAVHVYGNACDVEKIEEIAKKHNLKVIYDAAHAFGVKYKGRPITSYGDISMVSFHATKVFHTIEGGALIYNDDSLKSKIASLRNFGLAGQDQCDYIAMNAKMNEFQAAMGLCNLKHIDEEIEKRRRVVLRYQENLKGIKGIKYFQVQDNITPNYIYFPIVVNEEEYGETRDRLMERLADENIFSRKYFYPLTCDFKCYKDKGYRGDVEVARKIAERVLTLPLYASLTEEDVDRICKIIKKSEV